MKTLLHLTDVGAAEGHGTDSSIRIMKTYLREGYNVTPIKVGNTPFEVAFVACSEVDVLTEPKPKLTIAVNCAPRHNSVAVKDSKEDYLYMIHTTGVTFLVYGRETAQWVWYFTQVHGSYKIKSVPGHVKDTSKGSQFRSCVHLPIVHTLVDSGYDLDLNYLEETRDVWMEAPSTLVAPPDEYKNSRIIVSNEIYSKIMGYAKIEIFGQEISVAETMTQVNPGELSIWPSSNVFTNKALRVMNIGSRWRKGEYENPNHIQDFDNKLSQHIGDSLEDFLCVRALSSQEKNTSTELVYD